MTKTPNLVDLAEQLAKLGQTARSLLEAPDLELHTQRNISPNYETELIQVAAAAVGALEDLRLQQGYSPNTVYQSIERDIYRERQRADAKFGAMPRRNDPLVWVAVLIEETAEVSEEIWG